MGRITTHVSVKNLFDPESVVRCDALVDTGSAHMVFPTVWKERLGKLNTIREIDCETATQQLVKGEVCGPVEIEIEGFDPVYSEILFLEGTLQNYLPCGLAEVKLTLVQTERSSTGEPWSSPAFLFVKPVAEYQPVRRPAGAADGGDPMGGLSSPIETGSREGTQIQRGS